MKLDNYKTIEQKLARLESFKGNSLQGFNDGHTYAVYSYNTLIANRWLDSGRGETWITPEKYSNTTTRGLNIVKRAWGLN